MTTGRPRASSREVLSEAACELFLEKGFEATSITEIAARAGVSRSSFFNYFDSKDAILWLSLDHRLGQLESAVPPGDPVVALQHLCDGFEPDSLALALINSEAMGLSDELERAAAVRQARIARAVAASLVATGTGAVEAAVCGAAHAGAVMIAIERWARAGAGRASLSGELENALAIAAVTLPTRGAGDSAALD
ncbi:TetR family transcriptional regulator [Microbacterium oleivorans]|uniref:Transcriptional regulator n=1 Tax=Microbacterium oleivorans TaxID=273677 RepID=A0A031FZ66_9MICO|nr:TetR/AcrR family transcriptional regulator [Microbacterium oleivorans]AZS43958.1 Putative mycofactocin biosynthesis transcriptional regulator MftR [Microbacterium oleivorans]EZP29873.1 Transcriptional regulator [Microbacterium oleivorans]THE07105.1 TetR family transcriptional regulator [Microbacterium oleivorans]